MDPNTRKKYLLKRFDTQQFTSNDLDFFSKISASEIIILLKENIVLRNSLSFYKSVQVRQLQKIIASVFEPLEGLLKPEVLNILVHILKETTQILQVSFNCQDFNYMCLFGFLEQEHVEYPTLILFEDILLPYVRKLPAKIMEVLATDEHVQQIMLRRIYEKPIFKIIYTIIFCLSKKQSLIYRQQIEATIKQILDTPFKYLIHRQLKLIYSDMVITVPPESPKKNLLASSPVKDQLRTPRQNRSAKKKPPPSQQEKQIDFLGDIPGLANCQSQLETGIQKISTEKSQSDTDKGSIQKINKFVPINEDLDYADLAYNIKELFIELAVNIESIHLKNVLILLENFDVNYIGRLLGNCQKFWPSEEYQGYCQGIISILMAIIQLFISSRKNLQPMTPLSESEQLGQLLLKKLQKQINIIASKIPFFVEYILENNQKSHTYSSGQKLKKVGMIKYRMMELIVKILELNEELDLEIEFEKFDLMMIVEKYLTYIKWNNIVHRVILRMTELSVRQDYDGFRQKYIAIEKPKDGFLGVLVENFRNKKFIFLNNMKFSNYGNLNVIYELSRIIIKEVRGENDLVDLINKFPSFETFISKDLPDYQKKLQGSDYFDSNKLKEPEKHIIKCSLQTENTNNKVLNQPLETIGEIVGQLEDIKRWSPSPNRRKSRRRKESLLQLQIANQIDSLKAFQITDK